MRKRKEARSVKEEIEFLQNKEKRKIESLRKGKLRKKRRKKEREFKEEEKKEKKESVILEKKDLIDQNAIEKEYPEPKEIKETKKERSVSVYREAHSKYKLEDKELAKGIKRKKGHPALLDLREEVAILQQELEGIMNNPEKKTSQIIDIVKELRGLISVLYNIERDRKTMLTIEGVRTILVRIVKIIKKYVPDITIQRKMSYEIAKIQGPTFHAGDSLEVPMERDDIEEEK